MTRNRKWTKAAGILAAAGFLLTVGAPYAGAAEPGTRALQTRCSPIGGQSDLDVCVSTGAGLPTTAWFTNRSGVTYFGVKLRVTSRDGSFLRDGQPFTSHAHSGAIGMELTGLANNCYYGAVNLGGPGWLRTAEAACV